MGQPDKVFFFVFFSYICIIISVLQINMIKHKCIEIIFNNLVILKFLYL